MTSTLPAEPCPGCGLLYRAEDGPTHACIGASPACWARFGGLLALEYSSPPPMRWHRLTVDSYTAQHPGVAGRQSARSVHVHLAGLHLALERRLDPTVARAMQRLADGRAHAWLDPPPPALRLTQRSSAPGANRCGPPGRSITR